MKRKRKFTFFPRELSEFRGDKCLNCGHPLSAEDKYCARCGQLNSLKPLSLRDFLAEFIGSIIVYDSRFRFTIRDLLFYPGKITKNYVRGKRAKYANPFRFFLSVSIIYILLQTILGTYHSDESWINISVQPAKKDSIMEVVQKKVPKKPDDPLLKDSQPHLNAEQQKSHSDSLPEDHLSLAPTSDSSYSGQDTLPPFQKWKEQAKLYYNFYSETGITIPSVALENLGQENTRYNRWFYSRIIAGNKIMEDPNTFIDFLFSKIPFFLFFFSPFFALFHWGLYRKKKYNYMDHLIFNFHIFSFIFVSLFALQFLNYILNTQFFTNQFFLGLSTLYFYLALLHFYGQSWFMTLFKFGVLSLVFSLFFILFGIMFLAVNAAIYGWVW